MNFRKFRTAFFFILGVFALVLTISTADAGVVGTGTPASCNQAALMTQIAGGGTVTFNCGGSPVTIFVNSTISKTNPVTVIDGGGLITLDGSHSNDPIFWVFGDASVLPNITFRNIIFANASYTTGLNAGGAIVNLGILTLDNTAFTGNHAAGGGGAIFQEACTGCLEPSLVINQSHFTGNTANSGGAIDINGGLLTVTSSTFSKNSAGSGGAIDFFLNTGNMRIVAAISGSTFTENTASYSGGAISEESLGATGSLSIVNSTFTGNKATGTSDTPAAAIEAGSTSTTLTNLTISGNTAPSGVGLKLSGGPLVRNTIVSGNGAHNCSITGALASGSMYNLQSGDNSCTGFTTGDPLLGPLANNGGPTQTMLPATGSDAINAIPTGSCIVSVDQRGDPRPSGAGCDIGAVEVQQSEPAPVSPTEGTVGTEITIQGSDFGAKKGKVYLGTVALKVFAWNDEMIQCLINKPLSPSLYDVTIQPKGAPKIVLPNAFSVEAPRIALIDPIQGSQGSKVRIFGDFFGIKKGKVTLGGQNCKVLDWAMDVSTGESEILIEVPKRLTPGTYGLTVTNQVGTDTMEGAFTIP